MAEPAANRTVLAVTGAEQVEFLQRLVTNDVAKTTSGLVYSALLTPQGKYLADFFMLTRDNAILLDVATPLSDALLKRLNMYRLRADVSIAASDIPVERGLGAPPTGALPDPRHPALGWRRYGSKNANRPFIDWDAIRVAHCIPETGVELIPNDSFILEAGFERLSGVDFKKGCYVGQEVTARMKHKTELRKGFATVCVDGTAPVGTEILADDRPVGVLYSQSGGQGIAYLRRARVGQRMMAASAHVTLINRDAPEPC